MANGHSQSAACGANLLHSRMPGLKGRRVHQPANCFQASQKRPLFPLCTEENVFLNFHGVPWTSLGFLGPDRQSLNSTIFIPALIADGRDTRDRERAPSLFVFPPLCQVLKLLAVGALRPERKSGLHLAGSEHLKIAHHHQVEGAGPGFNLGTPY